MQDPKNRQKFTIWTPSVHHRTTLSGYIFATKACVHNRKELVKQQYLLYFCPHNMVNFSPLGAEIVSGVVTVTGICNSVGGSVLFDVPPRCQCRWRWRVQYAPCIAGQSSVPFPSPYASSQRTHQPLPPLLITTTRRDATRSSRRSVTRLTATIAATMASFNSA